LRARRESEKIGPRPTKKQLLYIAGLFDGEGCVSYNQSPYVSITSCYPRHLQMIASVMDMGRVRRMRAKKGPNRSCYRYELSGRNAIDFLLLIGPHLIEKSYQASLLIELDQYPPKSLTKKALIEELKLVKLVNY
jgi:hypothetical protein